MSQNEWPSWTQILIKKDDHIIDAISKIDASAGHYQICLVATEQKKLLGTVTDGDIRRAILKGISLNDTVSQIMNKNPLTIDATEPLEKAFQLMKEKELRFIPVVDGQNHILNVIGPRNLLGSHIELLNPVVIMAGGQGLRLRPLTNDIPKPMLKVGDRPLLQIIIENFKQQGLKTFFLAINYKGEKIKEYFQDGKKWGVEIQYMLEDGASGTAGALSLLNNSGNKPIIVMNADLLTKINFEHLIQFHQEQNSMATMCVRPYEFQIPYGVIEFNHERQITRIDEKPIHQSFVNAGIYIINPEALQFVPKNTPFDMTDLFEVLIEKKYHTSVFPIREYWLDIGMHNDYEKAKIDFNKKFSST